MICCDKCITVFSFNGRAYDRCFFSGVSIFGKDGVLMTDSGFEQSSEFKVRVPTCEEIFVKPGDRVVFSDCEVLDFEKAYTVMDIKDNRRGSDYVKHYVLTVK